MQKTIRGVIPLAAAMLLALPSAKAADVGDWLAMPACKHKATLNAGLLT